MTTPTVPGARPRPRPRPTRLRGIGFIDDLARHGPHPALHTDTTTTSYGELAARVAERAQALGTQRRLVLLEASHDVETVVTYLGALSGGHPVLLAPSDREELTQGLVAAYDPDVVARGGDLRARRRTSGHTLHPDLALLLSTSGSTGSPKLVRLSAANLDANARQIAATLTLRSSDVAMTTLPLHYCYGLSVLHSHLHAGAGILLTDDSVVDPGLWASAQAAGVTSLAGVPHTFDLLDRVDFDALAPATLRLVTQAGGRMDPATVRRFAELGQRRGFDLIVMYGQTEATARMATLPAELARTRPGAVGVAVPGGRFEIAPPEGEAAAALPSGVGELVYHGDNVMLGYAVEPADLGRGDETVALRTGDLARIADDGLVEIVGRCRRLAKVSGLRLDLDAIERDLSGPGVEATAYAIDGGDRLVLALDPDRPGRLGADALRRWTATRYGVPRAAVVVLNPGRLPRTPSGKPDRPALLALASGSTASDDGRASVEGLQALYAEVLGVPCAAGDSFVDLGGDSLSFVECSVRLEELLGTLPTDWHRRPVADLVEEAGSSEPGARSRWRTIETSVLIRALAILLVVGTHAHLMTLRGGAHVLLAVCGYGFARFHLTDTDRRTRIRHIGRTIGRVALPSALWIGGAAWLSSATWESAVFLQSVIGDDHHLHWRYWFVESFLHTLLALGLLVAIPAVDRAERRWTFGVPVALVGAGLLTRFGVIPVGDHHLNGRAAMLFWLFAIGWAAARAATARQRRLLTVLVAVSVPGFFDQPIREATIALGLLALIWVPRVRIPAALVPLLVPLASASLFIYLVHWQVLDVIDQPVVATGAALLAGLLSYAAWSRLEDLARTRSVAALGSSLDPSLGSRPARWATR